MNEPSVDTVFIGFRVPLRIAAVLRDDFNSSGNGGITITEGLNNLLKNVYGHRTPSKESQKWADETRQRQIERRAAKREKHDSCFESMKFCCSVRDGQEKSNLNKKSKK